ncbi:MAG: SpoIIE family protein phosphatase [Cyanobacteria bacterium RU_5_0]|nr:SpoIIE family protein phosphatase [Cyanobacteria bacterium RU_5_0]
MAGVSGSRLRLMVVDDESDNLDLLYRTFRRDFEVFKAESGFKALEILNQEGEMGIIISDQRMPRMNGTEFLSQTVDRFPDTIRILLTGYTDVEDLVGAINAGKVFKYITKPWNPDELKTVVEQAADTYRVVKQRTNELHRALRRESIFNAVTTDIRESLDYHSMLQTVVNTIGKTFTADTCILYPVETCVGKASSLSSETFYYSQTIAPQTHNSNGSTPYPLIPSPSHPLPSSLENCQIQLIKAKAENPYTQLIVPLTYQQEAFAILMLYKQGHDHAWFQEEMQLIQGVAEQAALAISQAKLYQRIQKQTEQMRTELAVARQIQMNLLRQSWSTSADVRVQAHCSPAREVGGDFFEVYVHPQGNVWIAVGDVSGKGVPAALFMASAISLLRRELSQETLPEPNIVLQNLNGSLSEELVGSNCFITMVLAHYSPATHELVYANAGHVYPLVWSHARVAHAIPGEAIAPESNYLTVRGVPLGILPVWNAKAGRLTLKSGEVLLLTSDGITEATIINPSANGANNGSMLKQSGLWELLAQQQGKLNLYELLASIQAHNPVQEDDQTILSLEVL